MACARPAATRPVRADRHPRGWTFAVVLLSCAQLQAHEEIPAYLASDTHLGESLNVTLVGSIQVEPPWDPEAGGYFSTTDLYIAGDYGYMGSNRGALHIVDISDPAAMRVAARVDMPGPALDVKVSGGLAVVATQNGPVNELGIVVVDVSDPPRARILSQVSNRFWSGVHNLFLYRDRAYLAHSASRGLTVVDLSDPTRPAITGTWINADPRFGSIIHDVFIRDGMAFLSDLPRGTGGLVVLDLSDPDHPQTLASVEIAEGLHNCFKDGPYVYCNQELGGWRQALHIVDVADPRHPVEAAAFRMKRTAVGGGLGPHNTWIEDGLLYWAFYDSGLRILDVRDPVHPVEVGSYRTPYAWGAQPHDDGLVYVADARLSSLRAFRFDRPEYRVRSASLSASSLLAGTDGTLAVTASVEPSRPGPAGPLRRVTARLLPDRGGAWTLRDQGAGRFAGLVHLSPDLLSGEYDVEVLAEDEAGRVYPYSDLPFELLPVRDLDLLDEGLPIAGSEFHLAGGSEAPAFGGAGPVYRGARSAAFRVKPDNTLGWRIDLRLPDYVDFLGYSALHFAFHPGDAKGSTMNLELGEYTLRLTGRGSRKTDLGRREWQVVEVPLDLFQRDRGIPNIALAGDLEGTFYVDDMRLVSERSAPTAVVEAPASLPDGVLLEPSYPNPSNAETTIRFHLPATARVGLRLYDISGQEVATLIDGVLPAGTHERRWSGRADGGRRAATGVYIYRLRVDERVDTGRLLLLR